MIAAGRGSDTVSVVRRHFATDTLLAAWDGTGTADGPLDGAHGIASDGTGSVYVAEATRVRRLTEDGVQTGNWPATQPRSVAVGPDGRIFAGDGSIRELSASGSLIHPLGARTMLTYYAALGVTQSGWLWAAEGGYSQLKLFTPDGAELRRCSRAAGPLAVAPEARGETCSASPDG